MDREPDGRATGRYAALFPVLARLNPPGAFGPRFVVKLSAAAQEHRRAIEGLAQAQAGMPDTSARLKAALGKWAGIYPRLVLTFHLIEIADAMARGEQPPPLHTVRGETASRAAAFAREVLLPHLLRADALLFRTRQTGHARWIAGHILASDDARQSGRVTARDLQRAYGPLRAPEQRQELEAVMRSLEVVAWVRAELPENPARPVTAWHVNPKLHVIFAERAAEERERRRRAQQAATEAAQAFRRTNP
jgi:hypothetical protein